MIPKDFANRLRDIGRNLIPRVQRIASVQALNETQAAMMDRIFKRGESKTGAQIGKYRSKKHITDRQKKGRQTAFKDYLFTGSLFAAIRKVEYQGSIALAIVDTPEIAKSRENEKRDKKAVFFLNDKELKIFESEYQAIAIQLLSQQQI